MEPLVTEAPKRAPSYDHLLNRGVIVVTSLSVDVKAASSTVSETKG